MGKMSLIQWIKPLMPFSIDIEGYSQERLSFVNYPEWVGKSE